MIYFGNMKDISDKYDEIWLIVRSLKSIPQIPGVDVFHMPVLSPSPELFSLYLSIRDRGNWNKEAFENIYRPRFLHEMQSEVAQTALNVLKVKGQSKDILLVCYCQNEETCHRSLIKELLENTPNTIQERNDSMKMCFTGRRPKDLHGYDHDAYIPMVEAIKECLRDHIADGYTEFISGGAQGFDQLAFWAVNALKREGYQIKNIVYVPFAGQEKAWKSTGLFSQSEYNLMLKLADEVKVLRNINTRDMREVVEAMHGRNHAMVDNANAVFGLYPDYSWQLPQTKGGTAECLKYAHSKSKKIYQLSNETLRGQWLSL